MEDIIRWLIKIEQAAGKLYTDAVRRMEADGHIADFLTQLARDEEIHCSVMKDALKCFHGTGDIRSSFVLDDQTRESIEAPLLRIQDTVSRGDLTVEKLMEFGVESEFFEWNHLFLYVINTLVAPCGALSSVAPKIQHHLRYIEMQLEQIPCGKAMIDRIRSLPPVWNEKILVADDEAPIAQLIGSVLGRYGTVHTASNGQEAFRKALNEYYAVIVSDLQMPVMDGQTLYRKLAERYPDAGRRFLFITGNLRPETMVFFRDNRLPYLEKPFSLHSLKRSVYDIMSRNVADPDPHDKLTV